MNLYRYCSGNPILHGDPTGLDRISNNKLNSLGYGGEWIDGSDGLSERDRHDHTSMGSGGGADGPESIAAAAEGIKVQWSDEGNRNQRVPALVKDGRSTPR